MLPSVPALGWAALLTLAPVLVSLALVLRYCAETRGRDLRALEGDRGADDPSCLTYGQSITDACIGWDDSLAVLETLHGAVKARRG